MRQCPTLISRVVLGRSWRRWQNGTAFGLRMAMPPLPLNTWAKSEDSSLKVPPRGREVKVLTC